MQIPTRHLALLAGSLFAVTAAIDIPHDQAKVFDSTLDYVLEASFTLALVAGAATLFSLFRSAHGWGPRLGFGLSSLGTLTVALAAGATLVNSRETLDSVFPLGLLGITLGYLVLAVADLRRLVHPRFAGLALVGTLVAMIAVGDGYGVIAWSAGFFTVAALLAPTHVTARREHVLPT
jgi:hypothetical protein